MSSNRGSNRRCADNEDPAEEAKTLAGSRDEDSDHDSDASEDPSRADVKQALAAIMKRLDRMEGKSRARPPATDATDLHGVIEKLAAMKPPRRRDAGRTPAASPKASMRDVLARALDTSRDAPSTHLAPTGGHSGDSSGSEDGGGSHRGHRPREAEPADGRLAPVIMQNLLRAHATALDYVRRAEFKNLRSMHEARRTAQAIDAFGRSGVSLHEEGMEILVRNLAGLVQADRFGDPSLLEELEWAPPEDLLPRAVLRTVLKDSKRRAKYKPGGGAGKKSSGAGGGAGGK